MITANIKNPFLLLLDFENKISSILCLSVKILEIFMQEN